MGSRTKSSRQLIELDELRWDDKYRATAADLVAECHGVRMMAL